MSTDNLRQTVKDKTARNPVKIVPIEPLKKPSWIRVKSPSSRTFYDVKQILREHSLHTVCEEASCPNIGECFGKGKDFSHQVIDMARLFNNVMFHAFLCR